MFLIQTLYQFVKDSFAAPSISVIKNSSIFQKNSAYPKTNSLSKQLSTIDFYIPKKSISLHNKESLQKSLYTQQKILSSLTSDCTLPIFTANESITNFMQYDFLKAGLYFSIQPAKIRKSEIFTTFEKIHRSFLNNFKSEKIKSQIKAHLSYLTNSYFYNYKPSPRILTKSNIVITKPDKGNGVVILDRKLYDKAILEIIIKAFPLRHMLQLLAIEHLIVGTAPLSTNFQ